MSERIENGLASIISVVFHPMLLTTYAFVILFNFRVYFSLGIPTTAKWMIGVFILVLTALLPLLLTFIMSRLGIIRTLLLHEREERLWPFAVAAIFYYLAYYLIGRLELSQVYQMIVLGAFLLVVAGLVISFFWKISVHMIGAGGMVGAFMGLSMNLMVDMLMLILLLILISGLVGFARLKLSAHTPAQILVGFIAGFAIFMMLFSL